MIRVSKSIVGKKESKAVENIINVGYLGMGEEVRCFENELETYIGNPDYKAMCVNTGTSALHLALESVTNPGDEVLVPSFTFVATYQAITAAGCIPISCEINEDTLLIDLNDAERRLTNKTKVILTALIGIIILSSCSAVKSGLSGRKENNTDEFLVKKKSPLSLPPKFEELPIPSSEDLNDSKQEKSDIQNLIMSGSQKNNKQTSKNQSIEEFISGKIKED